MNKTYKAYSFIGHRKIDITEKKLTPLKQTIENLITESDVREFLFGSRSEFNDLCHKLITELKEKYGDIKRVVYTCKNESCILENEKEEWQQRYNSLLKKDIKILAFEEEREFREKYIAGKLGYIKRNQAMIDDSDFCVFYFNKSYISNNQKTPRSNSGTNLAYKYAIDKNKKTINIALEF